MRFHWKCIPGDLLQTKTWQPTLSRSECLAARQNAFSDHLNGGFRCQLQVMRRRGLQAWQASSIAGVHRLFRAFPQKEVEVSNDGISRIYGINLPAVLYGRTCLSVAQVASWLYSWLVIISVVTSSSLKPDVCIRSVASHRGQN